VIGGYGFEVQRIVGSEMPSHFRCCSCGHGCPYALSLHFDGPTPARKAVGRLLALARAWTGDNVCGWCREREARK